MESDKNAFRVEFPDFSCSILQKLNQQRQRGQLCDIIVSIGGHQYRAHRAVLAASSPYFCDQVLLKNSARVVLPEVMNPWVFEGLLQSCYTGSLTLPSCEVVAFLTAASFLQMWHVVDKCTELLEGNTSRSHKTPSGVGCRGGSRAEQHPSPDGESHHGDRGEEAFSDGTGVGGSEGFGRMTSCRGSSDFEQLLDESFSPHALELGAPPSGNGSSPPDRAESASENGDPEAELPRSRPVYVPPSIMGHRKWTQVKTERPCRDDCNSLFTAETASTDSEQLGLPPHQGTSSMHSTEDSVDEKLVSELEESLDCDPLDFYGTSMDRFPNDKDESSPSMSKNSPLEPGPGRTGGDDDDDEDGMDGTQDETSNSGFGSGVYKLYPCQCGKSFTHKSQRDRHMSMHMGLRPYGCAVCGKSFKMKHHLVGHMKIHTGIKPYECSLCSKRFMWRDSFNRHTASCRRAHQAKRSATEQSIC
ncbi:zinc finger and BTB domain-containing protein 43 [Alosa pseudoharengus]|uniref:zinc finger and BTB domain-containing protein 43 n=1 Tax=Alosa pseudoharengus TaxID=34774 RepID=UPI003F893567